MQEVARPLQASLVTNAAHDEADRLICELYTHYYRRGWTAICVFEAVNSVRWACVLALSSTVLCATNWSEILAPCEVDECGSGGAMSVLRPLDRFGYVVVGCALAVAGTRVVAAVSQIAAYRRIQRVYDDMNLTEAELRVTGWPEVLEAFRRLNGARRMVHIDLDELSVARRITRRDNILIALLGANVLPSWCADMTLAHLLIRLWLDAVVIPRRAPSVSASHTILLARRVGVLLALVSPFVCIFFVCWTLVGHADDIRRRTAPSLLEREFTPSARVKHRGFNELMHEHDERLDAARPFAARCADHFPTPICDALTDVVHVAAASTMIFLIVVTLCSDDVLLSGRVWNQPVLWLLGLSSVVVSVTPIRRQHRASAHELRSVLRAFVQHMRATPPAWSVVGADALYDVRQLYRLALSIACVEIAGCVTVPWLLLIEVPRRAAAISAFLNSHLCEAPRGAGLMCDFALNDDAPRPEPLIDEDALVTAYLEASELRAPVAAIDDLALSTVDVSDTSRLGSWSTL